MPANQSALISASSVRSRCARRFSAWTESRPVPADGPSTTSPGRMAAAIAATTPSPVGVENCCNAWEVWDRRVWFGSRAPIFLVIHRAAGGDSDLRSIVELYLSRNTHRLDTPKHTQSLHSLPRYAPRLVPL